MNENLAARIREITGADLTDTSPADLLRALDSLVRADTGTYTEGDRVSFLLAGIYHAGVIERVETFGRVLEAKVLTDPEPGFTHKTHVTISVDKLQRVEARIPEMAGAR